jgi:hypothetical protein
MHEVQVIVTRYTYEVQGLVCIVTILQMFWVSVHFVVRFGEYILIYNGIMLQKYHAKVSSGATRAYGYACCCQREHKNHAGS